MPDNQTPPVDWVEQFTTELLVPILTGEWITWDEEPATEFHVKFGAILSTVNMARQRVDEQLDSAQNVGKFAKLERFRKARNSEDGPKEDPLALALKALTTK